MEEADRSRLARPHPSSLEPLERAHEWRIWRVNDHSRALDFVAWIGDCGARETSKRWEHKNENMFMRRWEQTNLGCFLNMEKRPDVRFGLEALCAREEALE